MTHDEWCRLIRDQFSLRPAPAEARVFLRRFETYSKPVLVACSDGREFVVKGRQVGRPIVTDHVVGWLGRAMQAPVGEVSLVDIPGELIQIEAQMNHLTPGPAHGSRWLQSCTDRSDIGHFNLPENRARFARLAVLYGWLEAADHQFIYSTVVPQLVHSVDHGHFLPEGPAWSMMSLANAHSPAPDARLVTACQLTEREISEALTMLQAVDDTTVACSVAMPPDEWGCPLDERAALAAWLSTRRDKLLLSAAA